MEPIIDALDGVGAGVVLYDRDDRFVFCNKAHRAAFPARFQRYLSPGVSFEQLLRACVEDGFILSAVGQEEAYIARRMRVHREASDSGERQFAGGVWHEIREYRTRDGGTVLTRQDITARKQAELALAESQQTLATLMSNLPGMAYRVSFTAGHCKVDFVSEGCLALTGYSPTEVVGREGGFLVALAEPEDRPEMEGLARSRLADRSPFQVTYRINTAGGEQKWVWEQGRGVYRDDGSLERVEGFVIDVTDAHRMAEELAHQATHDALSNLLNRRAFEERLVEVLEGASRRGSEHALAYMDLDNFKVINDTCGHVAGDELLRQLGVMLERQIGRSDSLARLGGDEFGVLMENRSIDEAMCVTEALQRAVEEFRFAWQDKVFSISLSIGLVPINAASASVNALMIAADSACYVAKDRGRNRTHVYRPDDEEIARRHGEMQWVARINSALEADRLTLYCQPILPVSSPDGAGGYYEFLVRMVEEDGSVVLPGAFLPAAERYGLASRLDRWVVEAGLAWMERRGASVAAASMCAFNLSGHSLADESFLQFVEDRLDSCGVPAASVCFEITETVAIANLTAATRFIEAMKRRGSRFALDDFGSGLSSFAYLKTLPVDYLKIDGMFVRDIVDDPIDRAFVKSINEIGHVMGMKTVAEFVESQAILSHLAEIGVDFAQGYAMGRPRPVIEID